AKDSIALLREAGIQFTDFHEDTRKLIFYDHDQRIKMLFVKAVDVPTYVEKGAADIGIVGKDNILESQADIYELLDLQLGKCKFVVAGLKKQPIYISLIASRAIHKYLLAIRVCYLYRQFLCLPLLFLHRWAHRPP